MSEPIECKPCRGRGCGRCLDTGIARCYDCQADATRTCLSDRDIPYCASCGEHDDRELASWLASVGVSAEVAAVWMSILPTMSTVDVHDLCSISNAEYLTVLAARCGKAAA